MLPLPDGGGRLRWLLLLVLKLKDHIWHRRQHNSYLFITKHVRLHRLNDKLELYLQNGSEGASERTPFSSHLQCFSEKMVFECFTFHERTQKTGEAFSHSNRKLIYDAMRIASLFRRQEPEVNRHFIHLTIKPFIVSFVSVRIRPPPQRNLISSSIYDGIYGEQKNRWRQTCGNGYLGKRFFLSFVLPIFQPSPPARSRTQTNIVWQKWFAVA